MTFVEFAVSSWAVWHRAGDGAEEWQGEPLPDRPVPLLLRRRVSLLGQRALKAAWSQPAVSAARLVFSSRHGEFGRTLSILDSLAANAELSPADFTLSVHHALAGLLSIAAANRAGHTAVSAGEESLAYGLLEAAVCHADDPRHPVILTHYDEPLPTPYEPFDEPHPEAMALALTLDGEGRRYRLSSETRTDGLHPEGRTADLIALLAGDREDWVFPGPRRTWRMVCLDAAA